MAQNANDPTTVTNTIENVIRDVHGHEVLRTTTQSVMTTYPSGQADQVQRFETVLLADGTNLSPGMLGKPENQLVVCPYCKDQPYSFPLRPPSSHGLIRFAPAKTCVACGQMVCSAHRTLGSDGKWRCVHCARKHARRSIFMSLLFSTEEQ
jgi:hypothetical protein